MIFKNMTESDCNLRLAGSYVMLQATRDSQPEPVLVRAIECTEERNELGYYDSVVRYVLVRTDKEDDMRVTHPFNIMHECPSLGYIRYRDGIKYLTRTPERQTKTGLPMHSTQVHSATGATRLESFRLPDACAIVRAAYMPEYEDRTAMLLPGHRALGPSVACWYDPNKRTGEVLGPNFMPVATYTSQNNTITISTKHPITVQRLLA